MYSIHYTDFADGDLSSILEYYNGIDENIPNRFRVELKKIISILLEHPEMFRIRYKNIRRINMQNFPYCLFYRIKDYEIEIMTIIHQSADPARWP